MGRPAPTSPSLSVVIELGTREITGKIALASSLRAQFAEAEAFGAQEVEMILMSAHPVDPGELPAFAQLQVLPGAGYYELKNEGARVARADYVVFWDSDCRPESGYLASALQILEAAPDLAAVGGQTRYDGSSWLSDLNTVLSFGYLYCSSELVDSQAYLAHNVVIRSSVLPSAPFGSSRGRTGGDEELTKAVRQSGSRTAISSRLRIRHEDPSFSLVGTLERHLREHFKRALRRNETAGTTWRRGVIGSALRAYNGRMAKLQRYGQCYGWQGPPRGLLWGVLLAYSLLDLVAVSAIALVPRLAKAWKRYQFGVVGS